MTEKSAKIIIVFVHGWSVTDTSTYGELPQRLRREAGAAGLVLQLTDIFLGRYISFHDEVRLCDISRAFHAALRDQLGNALANGERFVCITRSTGGPVLRDRWDHYYQKNPANGTYPMSHLIMLAPANYGRGLPVSSLPRAYSTGWSWTSCPSSGILLTIAPAQPRSRQFSPALARSLPDYQAPCQRFANETQKVQATGLILPKGQSLNFAARSRRSQGLSRCKRCSQRLQAA